MIQQDHLAVPTVYNVPMEDSLLVLEKRPLVFIRELFKYLTRGAGLLLSPVLEAVIFAKDDLLDENSTLTATESQLDARDVANIPNIEIMPVSSIDGRNAVDYHTYSHFYRLLMTRPANPLIKARACIVS